MATLADMTMSCQQFKVNMRPSSQNFGQVNIDFMMDFPESGEFDSVMVIVNCGINKGLILTLCNKRRLTAEHTVQLYIDNVYSRFGLPEKMISD